MNPNSAVERVKNHLAFKIGEVIESNNSRRWGRLDPGLHHLVASTRKKKEGGKGGAKQP